MKSLFATLVFSFISLSLFSQKEKTLSQKETQAILKEVLKQDKNKNLRVASDGACQCIDSISITNKSAAEIANESSACIDKQMMMYQMMKGMEAALLSKKDFTINISDNKNSAAYKADYYELERFLMDSCEALRSIVGVHNDKNVKSMSKNKDALKYYYQGEEQQTQNDILEAIKSYKLALAIDPEFAFCWDNLGLCYRRNKQYNDAIDAYNKSIEVDSTASTPYQNLAVVYEYQKKYKQASDTYERLVNLDKKNPEGYYGLGRALAMQDRDEEAVAAICKAYMLYVETKSPYRTDAEQVMGALYHKMKDNKKAKAFKNILKENNIDIDFK